MIKINEKLDRIDTLVMWGFPAKFVGKVSHAKAYAQGKEDAIKEYRKRVVGLIDELLDDFQEEYSKRSVEGIVKEILKD